MQLPPIKSTVAFKPPVATEQSSEKQSKGFSNEQKLAAQKQLNDALNYHSVTWDDGDQVIVAGFNPNTQKVIPVQKSPVDWPKVAKALKSGANLFPVSEVNLGMVGRNRNQYHTLRELLLNTQGIGNQQEVLKEIDKQPLIDLDG